ncbi:MAG: chromosome partitioning protein [Pseudonocardiales bacterium]|nr:chromosome partitioning protein [Pseudonocardiales bacterium]
MLVALCSFKGSPGVTTSALAIAACSPTHAQPVVVECDPAGGDIFARFRLQPIPGLVSLAAAARRGVGPGVLAQHTQRLPGGLPVVVGPAGAEQARAALGEITHHQAAVLRAAADQDGMVVLADCGRVDPDSPALPIVRAADALVLLVHARDDELAHVATRLDTAARWTPKPCLVLVGNGYPTSEVARVLGVGVMGRIPHDPKGAAILSGTAHAGRGLQRTPLGRAATRIWTPLSAPPTVAPVGSQPSTKPVPPPRSGLPVGSVTRTSVNRTQP